MAEPSELIEALRPAGAGRIGSARGDIIQRRSAAERGRCGCSFRRHDVEPRVPLAAAGQRGAAEVALHEQ
jgi:hypothetical protein